MCDYDLPVSSKYQEIFYKISLVKDLLQKDLKLNFTFPGLTLEEVRLNNQSLLFNVWNLIVKYFESIYFELFNENIRESDLRVDSETFSVTSFNYAEDYFNFVKVKFSAWNCLLEVLEKQLRSLALDDIEEVLGDITFRLSSAAERCSECVWVRKESKP